MNRRNFFQTVLATIAGIVGSKAEKTEEQQDIEDSLKSLTEPRGVNFETFTTSTYGTDFYVWKNNHEEWIRIGPNAGFYT